VDITDRHVAAVQLRHTEEGPVLWAATRFPRLDRAESISPSETSRIATVLERQGFRGVRLSLSLPTRDLLWETLELPSRQSGAPVDAIAAGELARTHGLGGGDVACVCWDIQAPARGGGQSHVVAAGCELRRSEALVGTLEDAGFEPVLLEPRPVSAARATASQISKSHDAAALIEISNSGVMPVVLYRDELVYSGAAPEAGVANLIDAICSRLRVTEDIAQFIIDGLKTPESWGVQGGWHLAEAARLIAQYLDVLAKHVQSAVGYVTYRYPSATMSDVLLFGAGADLPGVRDHVGLQIVFSPRIIRPIDVIRCDEGCEEHERDAALITPIGLAMAEVRL
jgi:Tfp pilus assembly PilM family ATPase